MQTKVVVVLSPPRSAGPAAVTGDSEHTDRINEAIEAYGQGWQALSGATTKLLREGNRFGFVTTVVIQKD